MVQTSLEELPKFKELFSTIYSECRKVNSYSDYQNFLLVMAVMGDDITVLVNQINILLGTLELQGYDEHPKVGPMISEIRQLASTTGNCLEDMQYYYGN